MTDDNDPVLREANPALDAIDSLLDGESVDREVLRSALADPDARDYFIDALQLRHLAAAIEPSDSLAPASSGTQSRRLLRWIAAAVVVVGVALSGYAVGRHVPLSQPDATVEGATASPPAPAATRVIHFERGSNWFSSVERN
jgi:hypothetical protein